MQVEIFSDIVCPWCYIGSRRFAAGLADFEHAEDVELRYRSFELDPNAPTTDGIPVPDYLGDKYGGGREAGMEMIKGATAAAAGEGLEYHLDKALRVNSFDAHRLLHLAWNEGGWNQQAALKERLFKAYFTDAENIADHAVLTREAVTAGLDEARVAAVLAGEEFAAEVREDLALARELGVTSVPFYVLDRTFGVSGAQDAEIHTTVLDKAWKAAEEA